MQMLCKQRKLPNGISHMSDICIKPSKQTFYPPRPPIGHWTMDNGQKALHTHVKNDAAKKLLSMKVAQVLQFERR